MLSVGKINKDKLCDGCDHLYYNIVIPHKKEETVTKATYNKLNTIPILDVPEDYHVAVVRFSVSTSAIPIHICRPQSPSSDDLIYNVSIRESDTGNISTVALKWTDESTIDSGSVNNPFRYFVYTYSKFITMVNIALEEALTNLEGAPPDPTHVPRIIYTPETRLFTIIARRSIYDESIAGHYEIFFNASLESLLTGLESIYYINGFEQNKDLTARIRFYDKYNNIQTSNAIEYFYNSQDYPILNAWNSFKTLQIGSNLPIQNEFTDANYEETAQTSKTTSENILKDYIVLYAGDVVARTTVDYTVDEYEYIDLKGIEPIRNISLDINWLDNYGIKYPLYLKIGETISIKLMFKKKYKV